MRSITHSPPAEISNRVRDGIIVLTAALTLSSLLLVTIINGIPGFPLDDAWIHQTYARNLLRTGQWAFIEGIPSAGSTSPLWTLLLTPGHIIAGDVFYRVWTYSLGFVMLAATGLGLARLANLLAGNIRTLRRYVALLAGLAIVIEWHMVWAAGSGMETLLFIALSVWLWCHALREAGTDSDSRFAPPRIGHGFVLGLLGGALTLTRPEGILAIGLAGLYGLLRWRKRGVLWGLSVAAGGAIFLLPYLALNLSLNSTLLPNTSAAKQAEFAIIREAPYLLRFARFWYAAGGPFVGPQLLLLPGLIVDIFRRLRDHNWRGLLPLGWALAHIALYAWRLPVTYQHGRYAMPVIPVIVLYGLLGTLYMTRPVHMVAARRLLSMSWLAALAVLFPMFLVVLGIPAYLRDVGYIESEMVDSAGWIEANVEPHKLVAVHDIGAIGFFAPRQLIDLAGLVSPDVIPIIGNQAALLDLMEERQAGYLVTFPGWYPQIVADGRVCKVYSTGGEWAPLVGGENMAVYELHWQGEPC